MTVRGWVLRRSRGLCAGFLLVSACSPTTRVLLYSRCDASSDGECSAQLGPPRCPELQACPLGPADCGAIGCAACPDGGAVVCPPCPPGTLSSVKQMVERGCSLCMCRAQCKLDSECGPGALCAAGSCKPCAAPPQVCDLRCPLDFRAVVRKRNGCASCECAPQNECLGDADCGPGQRCYPGAQCHEGCDQPDCCFGNTCAAVGCTARPDASCALIGCAQGSCVTTCKSGGKPQCDCTGSPGTWECSDTGCEDAHCE